MKLTVRRLELTGSDVSPSHAADDSVDAQRADVELSGYFGLSFTINHPSPNLQYLLVREFCFWVCHAVRGTQAILKSMLNISKRTHPFQVFYGVVVFIAVNMIHRKAWGQWRRPCKSNNSVHGKHGSFAITAKVHAQVAPAGARLAKLPARNQYRVPTKKLCALNRKNATVFCDFVKPFVPGHGLEHVFH